MEKKMCWEDCGGCPDFRNIIYFDNFDSFIERDDKEFIEDMYCNSFIWPIKLTKEEYEKIPDWCPMDNDNNSFKRKLFDFFKYF